MDAVRCSVARLSVLSTQGDAVESMLNGCGAHLCEWCLTICKNKLDCHDHVTKCTFNPSERWVKMHHGDNCFVQVIIALAESHYFHQVRIPKFG